MKKGISLMVLVITIIVIIILAAAIILMISNRNSINKASEVTKEHDVDKVQLMAELGLNELLKEHNGNLVGINVEEKLEDYLKDKNVDINKFQVGYKTSNSTTKGQVVVSEIEYIPIYSQEDLSMMCSGKQEQVLSDGKKYNMLNTANYKLMNDITITQSFQPIGTLNGRLYGNNKTIILKANFIPSQCMVDFSNDISAASLIGVIGENGLVKDLGIDGTLTYSDIKGNYHVATIAGINIGTIDGCHSNVNITTVKDETIDPDVGAYVGGLAAYNANTVMNSYNTGKISTYYRHAGGIVGTSINIKKYFNINSSSDEDSSEDNPTTTMITKNINVTIKNSYNTGKIFTTNVGENEDSGNGNMGSDTQIGGIASGIAFTEISSCYNAGEISSNFMAGGIVAKMGKSSIKDCYNIGKISTNNVNYDYCIAGIASAQKSNCTIYNCINLGLIQGPTLGDSYKMQILADAGTEEDASKVISKCYYLENNDVQDSFATEVSAVQMKSSSFVNTLNSNSEGAWKAVTSGYPKLSWE